MCPIPLKQEYMEMEFQPKFKIAAKRDKKTYTFLKVGPPSFSFL